MHLRILDIELGIARLPPSSAIPEWAHAGPFSSVTKTPEELSIVCRDSSIPDGVRSERGFACLQVAGPLDFSLTGVLASLANPLAEAEVSIVAISTFDTDFVMVKSAELEPALRVLRAAGHVVE